MTESTERLSAALADRYRILRQLGEGGMAAVYLAEDLKHKRQVAVKVLKPELAAVLGAERFVQEIQTTAGLQHPHILPLFDSGEAGGFLYYVMPYIEGETLRSKLDRETQLGIEEAVRLTSEVADALDYAHRHGVIHRDIKPENILLHDGRPMVADFGIALAVSAAAGGRMTETGLSLGTPHYMSPEQATAEKEITARSDIYSLGSVLYEMLAGNPPHTGNSAQQIIMKIIAEDVEPVTKYRKSIPSNVAAATEKALEKLPADRFYSARALADALADPAFSVVATDRTSAGALPATTRTLRWALAAALALNLVLAAVIIGRRQSPDQAHSVSSNQVVLWNSPTDRLLDAYSERTVTQATIAPDGSSIVFSDSVGDGVQLLRKLRDRFRPELLAGTEGAWSPVFSPDGQWIAYITVDGRLKKVPVTGGGSVTLAEDVETTAMLATWLDDGSIIYRDYQSGLRRVPSDGGESISVLPFDPEGRMHPNRLSPLPGSRGILYTVCPGNCATSSAVYLYDLVADSARFMIGNAAEAWYVDTGHLVYTLREGGLYAVPFDLDRREIVGGAFPVISGVVPGSFVVSPSGAALYTVGSPKQDISTLVWVTRDGVEEPVDPSWQGIFEYPALAPDGMTLAVSLREESTNLWIRSSNGTRHRLIPSLAGTWRASWTPDGDSVVFVTTGDNADNDAYLSPAAGGVAPRLLLDLQPSLWEVEYSQDRSWLLVRVTNTGLTGAIIARATRGDTSLVTVVGGGWRSQIALSPDNRWLAYTSDESGGTEVYLTSFPDAKTKHIISQGGGTSPRWAHSGRELFFKSHGQLMSVPINSGPDLVPAEPRPLFPIGQYRAAVNRQQYDVSPDDKRFLMIRPLADESEEAVVYVENFFQELRPAVAQ